MDIHKITANKVHQWCLDKQEALYKEIVSVTGPQGKITQANLSSMKYLKVCSNFLAISKYLLLPYKLFVSLCKISSGYGVLSPDFRKKRQVKHGKIRPV